MDLDKEVALVTGGGQGLGRAISLLYARHGAAVAIGDIDVDAAERVAREIRAGGGRALALDLDVSSLDSARRAAQEAIDAFGTVSVLVNSAIFARYGPIDDIQPDIVDRMLAVGLKGPLLMSRAVAPAMRSARHGLILNISSVVGLGGVAYSSGYAALKGGVDAITRSLAAELGPSGVRVNSIAPSAIPNEMSRRTLDSEGWEERRRRTPLGVLGEERDVANAALFLASPAARFLSGVILPVDGGFSSASMIADVDIASVQKSRAA
ncbi:3-oxoacyl-[acyl-carrier protein] reductase [Paracandidimonas soli]|uniref:3-oxoacyl-[acyl-carrier protein] reductase n=2 Tax=Paracandidimonas soli TaxID=1917182 RepID=A0A4V2VQV6_9BURK|nr:3-oxoacyl-[acyl-carrier protein] reductase [Paracandidimonas soli]